MQISEERLLAFIELYEKEFGITLTRSEAHEKALLLMQYGGLFIQPLAEIDENDINNMSNISD